MRLFLLKGVLNIARNHILEFALHVDKRLTLNTNIKIQTQRFPSRTRWPCYTQCRQPYGHDEPPPLPPLETIKLYARWRIGRASLNTAVSTTNSRYQRLTIEP